MQQLVPGMTIDQTWQSLGLWAYRRDPGLGSGTCEAGSLSYDLGSGYVIILTVDSRRYHPAVVIDVSLIVDYRPTARKVLPRP
jgi:hypothetical protein